MLPRGRSARTALWRWAAPAQGADAGGRLRTMELALVLGVAVVVFLLGAMSGSGFVLAWRDRRIARQVADEQRDAR